MKEYNHQQIEKKWQKIWEKDQVYRTDEDDSKPKSYVLDMFPYPSGEGLHAGHVRVYTASDVYSRLKRMQGYRVLHPTGWDAFGLPAERFAIKNKIHPRKAVDKNVANFKRQMNLLGFSYDWEREIDTTDPRFYKWTQWIFLKLLQKGLAYESYEPITWCPTCQTGLSNEDLEGNNCEICGTPAEKKPMRQWVLKITDYADRLVDDLSLLAKWPVAFCEAEKNWVGKSEGAEVEFPIKQSDKKIKIFTTRPDTLFGATYMVLAPDHNLVFELKDKITNWDEVEKYIVSAKNKTEIERTAEGKEKTGAELNGIKAINPANEKEIPVFIADYVLKEYGTGAIMAVPTHDTRDFEFAQKFSVPIITVISGGDASKEAYAGPGHLVNSAQFDGLNNEEAKTKITKFVGGKLKTTYKLRDWVFSRQRYWGEPIPVIHCEKDGIVSVPEDELPVLLPEVKSYEPTGTGESPLAEIEAWVNTKCPKCGGPAKRETNTMPQWAGSSWYYLRFIDPKNNKILIDKKKEKKWMPVDVYVGGAEHATRHLIYARFWHKFLYDIGIVSTKEPFTRLESVGLILGEGGTKMSKRLGNTVNPDEIVEIYGADTLRLYEMFIGPFSQASAWNPKSIIGSRRFLEKIWRIAEKIGDSELPKEISILLNQTIKKVGEDIEAFKFNTAISQLMILSGEIEKLTVVPREIFETLLKLITPLAPHVAEELWQKIGNKFSINREKWPSYDESKLTGDTQTIVIQINGKVRGSFVVPTSASGEEIRKKALENEITMKWLGGKEPKRVVYVPGKLVSIVV